MEEILLLAIALIVITLLGHGLWVLARALLRLLFRAEEPVERPGRRCGFCSQPLPLESAVCPKCRHELTSRPARQLMHLAETETLLSSYRQRRSVPAAELQSLLCRLQDEQTAYRRLLLEEVAKQVETRPAGGHVGEAVAAEIVTEARGKGLGIGDWGLEGDRPQPVGKHPPAPAHAPPWQVPPRPAAPPPVPPPPVSLPPEPLPPRRSLAEMLAEFMEPHNIRWGEIIGGLLLIVGAAALVISQWDTLQQMRYLRFAVFGLGSGAVFGAGFYSFYRWRLEATGRGLLLVATLLVPLNFLAISGMSKADPLLRTLACEAVSLAALGALVTLAGRVLVPGGRWLLTIAVMGTSATLLVLVRRFELQGSLGLLAAAGCLPLAALAGGVGPYLLRFERRPIPPSRGVGLFNLLGTGGFGMCLAWGMMAAEAGRSMPWTSVLPALALPIALAGGLAATVGLTVLRGMRPAAVLEPFRVAGTWVALLAAMVMLAALPLAWPSLGVFTLVAVLDAVGLAALAIRFGMPLLHAGAIAALAAAWLVAYHLLTGHLAADTPLERAVALLHWLVEASSGVVLLALAVVLAGLGELLVWRRRMAESQVYLIAAGVTAAVSLGIVTARGWSDASGAAAPAALAVYAIDAAVAAAINVRLLRRELSYLTLGLALGGLFWVLWWWCQGAIEPAWAATFAAAGLAMALPATALGRAAPTAAAPGSPWLAGRGRRGAFFEAFRLPLWHMADFTAAAALTLALVTAWRDPYMLRSWTPPLAAGLLTALYLVLAWGHRSPLRTAVGSIVFGAGLIDVLVCVWPWSAEPWAVALLTHATLAEAVAWGVQGLLPAATGRGFTGMPAATGRGFTGMRAATGGGFTGERAAARWAAVFVEPLRWTALVSSAGAVLAMVAAPTPLVGLAACLAWLAVVWLAMAWRSGWAELLAAHQLAAMAAVVAASAAWLNAHGWQAPAGMAPLHFYGLGLGVPGLAWVAARIAARRSPPAARLLNPGWPLPDVWLRHGLVAVQALWLAPLLLGEALREWNLASGSLAWAVWPGNPPVLGGAWLMLGLLIVVAVASLGERWGWAELVDGLLLSATLAGLAATPAIAHRSLGSALRWTLAIFFLAGLAAVWGRRWLRQWARRVGARVRVGSEGPVIAQAMLVALGAAPVVLATCIVAGLHVAGGVRLPMTGLLARLPIEVNYLLPVALVVAGLVGQALHARSAGYAFAAGRVCELTVGLGYIVKAAAWGPVGPVAKAVTLIEVLVVTNALWSLGWMTVRRRLDIWRETARLDARRMLMSVQLGLGYAAMALLLSAALLLLALVYPHGNAWTTALGGPMGGLALVLVAAAAVVRAGQTGRVATPNVVGLAGMAVLGWLACAVERYAPGWGYRSLMLGWAGYALAIVAATWWITDRRGRGDALGTRALAGLAGVWVRVAGLAAVALGLRAAVFPYQPVDPLWGAAAIAGASAAGAAMAAWQRRSGWAFAAAWGVNLAASIVVWHYQPAQRGDLWWIALLEANALASAASSLVWLAGLGRLYPRDESRPAGDPWLAIQVAMPLVANVLWLGTAALWIVVDPPQFQRAAAQLAHASGWLALLATSAAAGWYALRFYRGAAFHVMGGMLAGLVLLVTAAVAARPGATTVDYLHALVAGWPAACAAALALGWLGTRPRGPAAEPLVRAELVCAWAQALGAIAVAAALWCAAGDSQRPWWSAGALLAVGGVAGVLVPWRREPFYAVTALSLAGWALLPAQIPLPWMHRAAVVLAASSAVLIACGYVLPRWVRIDAWRAVLRRGTPRLMAVTGVALAVTLVQEVVWFAPQGGVMNGPVMATVIVALAALAGLCIAWAVEAQYEPWGLELRQRMVYVYAAELLLGLLGLHLYLTAPWLFGHGFFRRYGLLVMMGGAFGGAGVSEWFGRRGVAVLAQPLARTAMALPILAAVVSCWLQVDATLLWFSIAAFYGLQTLLRPSVWTGLMAVAAGNVALGLVWHRMHIDFLVHPQIWLIPPALAGLVAEHLSRPRLRAQQSAALRYLLLATIYVASTADMFIAGLGASVLLPLVLLGLSVLGILLGMALRIRSFLYLGVVFLLVVVTSLLKYVTIDLQNTWVLWVCVIALGASLIALFAVFEKRRAGLSAAVERFKRWEN